VLVIQVVIIGGLFEDVEFLYGVEVGAFVILYVLNTVTAVICVQ
jgi:hypothetical protein